MNLQKMIGELQAEKERLDEAILALERLSAGKPKRRSTQAAGPASSEEEPELLAKAHVADPTAG